MKDYSQFTVGVLALQGAVSEHIAQLHQLGAKTKIVKIPEDLNGLDALVLPGGESTAMAKLMERLQFIDAIRHFAEQKKPIFGTCAGMILLAKDIEGGEPAHLQLMDIKVQRNAFGRQVDSFQTDLDIQSLASPFPSVFIRAPYIVGFDEQKVTPLATFNSNLVLAKQEHFLACAFHPELTADNRVMQLFLEMI